MTRMRRGLAQKQQAIALHSQQAESFASRYETASSDLYASCFAYSRKRLDAWLDRCLPANGKGLRVLDVGCGTGHQLARLRERGFDVTGVDGSAEMLAHARQRNLGVALHLADVEALPFADGSFDVVISIEVLRYLPDETAAIGELARVLRPGGTCLATATPLLNLNGYWVVNRIAAHVPARLTTLRQFFTTSGRLRRRFTRAGFSRVDVHGVYIGPVNWVERLAPVLLRRVLQSWEPWDAALADRPLIRELANMFLVCAVRG
jgi:ubiquinone/menaquinone biosynthesis C-methylase UbiE